MLTSDSTTLLKVWKFNLGRRFSCGTSACRAGLLISGSARRSLFALFTDSNGGFVRSIVICAEPFVPGRVGSAVIAFEISVMELVVKVCGTDDAGIAHL